MWICGTINRMHTCTCIIHIVYTHMCTSIATVHTVHVHIIHTYVKLHVYTCHVLDAYLYIYAYYMNLQKPVRNSGVQYIFLMHIILKLCMHT